MTADLRALKSRISTTESLRKKLADNQGIFAHIASWIGQLDKIMANANKCLESEKCVWESKPAERNAASAEAKKYVPFIEAAKIHLRQERERQRQIEQQLRKEREQKERSLPRTPDRGGER